MGQTVTLLPAGWADGSYLDLTHEQTSVPSQPIDVHRAWRGGEVDPRQCVITLDAGVVAELRQVRDTLRAHPLPMLLRKPDQFSMPRSAALMAEVRAKLDHEVGVAALDALPLDEFDADEATTLFWVLGQAIGRPVAQKWDGTMLYHVRDTGQTYGYGVRGSCTNVELGFHNDNAFGIALPRYIGLCCLAPAQHGGVSRLCSLCAVHNRLLWDDSTLLARLYQPMLWDRQAEHAPGAPKAVYAPMFRWDGARFLARVNISLVEKGYAVAGLDMDLRLEAALALLGQVMNDPELWFELPLGRGQLQYLDNLNVVHYRSEFVDHPDTASKRHLLRTWHRDGGRPTYDG